MKVLLFTHMSDIDGMGNAVLAKLAFENVNYYWIYILVLFFDQVNLKVLVL